MFDHLTTIHHKNLELMTVTIHVEHTLTLLPIVVGRVCQSSASAKFSAHQTFEENFVNVYGSNRPYHRTRLHTVLTWLTSQTQTTSMATVT